MAVKLVRDFFITPQSSFVNVTSNIKEVTGLRLAGWLNYSISPTSVLAATSGTSQEE